MAQNSNLTVVKGEDDGIEEKGKKRLPKWLLVCMVVLFLFLIVVGMYWNYHATETFNSYETICSTVWQNAGEYKRNGNQVIRYTGNGAEAVDEKGNEIDGDVIMAIISKYLYLKIQ